MTAGLFRQQELIPEEKQSLKGEVGEVTTGGDAHREQSEEGRFWRDSLLTAAAHEIRNPLNALRGELQLAVESISSRPDLPTDIVTILNNYLSKAIISTGRIRRLIDDLTDVGFASGGMLHLERKWVDLVTVICEIVQRTQAADRDCPRIILAVPETMFGLWDRMRVEQVISNLLDNAIRFCNGQPIEIYCNADCATVYVEVRDHGAGIPATELERIFRPFQSAHIPSRCHPGLGLWIVRQALSSMGGSITVSSKVGEGSTFRVELPINQA